MKPALDVITIGRASVDLYGQQVGGRLEDMASFSKAVGGCPANIAIGTARLGLKSGLVTRVGVRIPMASGFAVAAGGMLLLSAVSRDGSYVGDVLPGMLVAGAGLGLVLVSRRA